MKIKECIQRQLTKLAYNVCSKYGPHIKIEDLTVYDRKIFELRDPLSVRRGRRGTHFGSVHMGHTLSRMGRETMGCSRAGEGRRPSRQRTRRGLRTGYVHEAGLCHYIAGLSESLLILRRAKAGGYQLRELPVTDSWIVTDDNLLTCSPGPTRGYIANLQPNPIWKKLTSLPTRSTITPVS